MLPALVQTKQPLWTGAMACYPHAHALEQKFTVHDRFGEEFKLYAVRGDKIMLPRAVCPVGAQDLRVRGVPARFDKLDFTPRNDEQAAAVAEAIALLKADESFILQAPTGGGKTAITMPMIAAVGRTTMIVVPKEDLLGRWAEDLTKILGLTDREIGIMQSDNFQFSGRKVVVGMLQSLAKLNRYPSFVMQELGFLIFDEVHRLGADHFMTVAGAYPALLRMGLSATVDRRDGREAAFKAHIGPIKVTIAVEQEIPMVLAVNSGWRCPRKRDGKKLPHVAGRDAHVRKILFGDAIRNALIGRAVKSAYDKGRDIVVFSDYVEHCQELFRVIRELGVPSQDMGFYMGQQCTARELERTRGCKVKIATYGKMAEGTDIPWIDTVVLAGPRSDIRQAVGRCRRPYEGKQAPVVIDIRDDDSGVYKGFGMGRDKWYAKLGCKVMKNMTI